MSAKCNSCGAAILWARTATGAAMPIDAQKDLAGNVSLKWIDDGQPIATVGAPGSGHYVSHFATCVNAKSHRKQRPAP